MEGDMVILGINPDAPEIKVLSVDDDQYRHATIYGYLRGLSYMGLIQAVQRTRTGPATVTNEDIAWADIVCLDHDMCQAVPTRTDSGLFIADCPQPLPDGGSFNLLNDHCGCPTGRDMARKMIQLPARPFVIIRTQNSRGGMTMQYSLQRRGFAANIYPADQWDDAGWGRHLNIYFLWKGSQS